MISGILQSTVDKCTHKFRGVYPEIFLEYLGPNTAKIKKPSMLFLVLWASQNHNQDNEILSISISNKWQNNHFSTECLKVNFVYIVCEKGASSVIPHMDLHLL